MKIGDKLRNVSGFVTQLKYLNNRRLFYMEQVLGFHGGRLAAGASIVSLDKLPTIDQFETFGYSQVAEHHHKAPTDLDPVGLRRMAMSVWTVNGPNSLVKVIPVTPHSSTMSSDDQYPPGKGIPQWKLKELFPGTVVAVLAQYNDWLKLM